MSRRTRLFVRLGAAVLSIGAAGIIQIDGLAEPAGSRIGSGRVFVRDRTNSVTSISASTIDRLPDRKIDELLTQLPSSRKITPGYLPDGWSAEQKGKDVRAWGPPIDTVNLRYDLGGSYLSDYVGKQATLRTGFMGRLDDPIKVTIEGLPPVSTTPDLDGILTVPPRGVAGQPLLVGVAPGYRDGRWEFTTGRGSIPLVSLEELRDMPVSGTNVPQALYGFRENGGLASMLTKTEPRPFITALPQTEFWRGVRYTDPWGETLVDAPVSITAVPAPAGGRMLSGASSLAFAGQAACVSGRFPTFEDAYGLKLDGQLDLQPWGVSPTSVMLGIPDTTAAGPHTISTPDGSSSVTVGVLTVEGTLDQNKLWRGESTTMRLRIVGTDETIPLAILNRTPGIITLEGGIRQVLTTPGGVDNAITRRVTGIQRGNFTILYSVNS
jgi:hypothetical protein